MGTQIIVGCDPHKLSLTLAAVDGVGNEIDIITVANDAGGISSAVAWLEHLGGVDRVGIEGSAGHGHQLATALIDAGVDVREVPARRTAQRRRARRRPKTDRDDAVAIARATAGEPGLGPVRAGYQDPVLDELSAVNDWRDDLVEQRKRALNQAEGVMTKLPVEVLDAIGRTGKTLARLRRAVAIDTNGLTGPARMRIAHLAELLERHRQLSATINDVEAEQRRLVRATGTTLRDEVGIGDVGAARLVVEIGDPTRFRSEAAFARWCGTAAVAVSSGEGDQPATRHRLDLGGNRRVNSTLHIASIVQGRIHPDARRFLTRKRTEGKTTKEARRAHKRRLADRVIRRMWRDAQTRHQHAA